MATVALSATASQPYVDFITPTIVRVRWNPEGKLADNATGACVYPAPTVNVREEKTDGLVRMMSDSLIVEIPEGEGGLRFIDRATGKVLFREDPSNPRGAEQIWQTKNRYDESSAHLEDTANGKVTVKDVVSCDTIGKVTKYSVRFLNDAGEGVYGLGSHMEDYMNLLGKELFLTQHNLKAFVPVVVSTGGYGLLFDAGCSMKYKSSPTEDPSVYGMEMEMEAANMLDYYFIKGALPEDVVEGYRYLTGNVSMMPLYTFGYIQSKERYVSSEDLINTVREYRRRHVPLDMIVQDWNYWPEGWGYMKMNREMYPDPKALADSIHSMNAKIMISIWPNPQYCPEEKDFREKGFMLEGSVYDVFNPAARDLYWEYADKEFFSNGFDAWWCDSSEPLDGDWNQMPEPENGKPYSWDDHERRWKLNDKILSESLGAERACLYSFNHSKGIYDHQRAATDRKRVVNLTRSTFPGQQRYGTIVWNGDTHASWNSFKQQIPAGLNYMATGNPYWTVDVGCFFIGSDPRWFRKGEFPAGVADEGFREFYTRMFQYGTFLPVLRSHGTETPREIWQFGEEGTPYYDAILKMIKLRYSLLPYTYSMAAAQTNSGFSMARPLAFDFPEDKNVFDIKDQYMFGDIMVCPVTDPGVTSRRVYLPRTKGGWIDFWTGRRMKDGETAEAEAPLERLPLFVKGGSIVITTAPVEYSAASVGKPVTIDIYPGSDAEFTLYDDAGDNYDFEKGEWTRVRMNWDDDHNILTIDDAVGTYVGAPEKRQFIIRKDGKVKKIDYNGKKTKIKI